MVWGYQPKGWVSDSTEYLRTVTLAHVPCDQIERTITHSSAAIEQEMYPDA